MKHFKIIFILAMLLSLTMGYSLFLYISSGTATVFVKQMEASPGFLFDLMVKPYVVWSLLAWISFFINSGRIVFPLLKKKDPIDYIPASFFHLLWISVSLIWHSIGLFSPFLTKVSIIN